MVQLEQMIVCPCGAGNTQEPMTRSKLAMSSIVSSVSASVKESLPYYAYIWAYPDGVVFYVGIGAKDRYLSMKGRSPLVCNIVRNIESMGHSVQRTIIARFKVRQHAAVYERMLIETYGIENLANIKSEVGEAHYHLARPFEVSTIQPVKSKSERKAIDRITLYRMTQQLWEDDGAAI